MSQNNDDRRLPLRGLDGANPLGFLAAVGTLTLLDARTNDGKRIVRMRWEETAQGWRPSLQGFDGSESDLCDVMEKLLKDAPVASLQVGGLAEGKKISNKFPFAAGRFRDALTERAGDQTARLEADLLAGLGAICTPIRSPVTSNARLSRWCAVVILPGKDCCTMPKSSRKGATVLPWNERCSGRGTIGTRDTACGGIRLRTSPTPCAGVIRAHRG